MNRHLRPTLLLAILLLATSTAAAQRDRAPQDEPKVVTELKNQLARLTLDYWSGRLNDYKQRIDRTLSPADLAELNRARVFTSLFIEEKRWNELAAGAESLFEGGSDEEELEWSEEAQDFVPVPKPETAPTEEKVTMKGAEFADRVSELLENFFLAKRLARRYRQDLGDLRESVMTDIGAFADSMIAFKSRFERQHRAEIDRNEDLREAFGSIDREKLDGFLNEARSSEEAEAVFTFGIEPLLMLYNGQDVLRLLRENDAMPEELAGLDLPEVRLTATMAPGPGSGSLGYRLVEPSSATTIRIYNATGELVATYDQGPRPAGEHSVAVDFGKLPSGTYLYTLSTVGPTGPRLYSRSFSHLVR